MLKMELGLLCDNYHNLDNSSNYHMIINLYKYKAKCILSTFKRKKAATYFKQFRYEVGEENLHWVISKYNIYKRNKKLQKIC